MWRQRLTERLLMPITLPFMSKSGRPNRRDQDAVGRQGGRRGLEDRARVAPAEAAPLNPPGVSAHSTSRRLGLAEFLHRAQGQSPSVVILIESAVEPAYTAERFALGGSCRCENKR